MRTERFTTVTTYAILALAGCISFSLPDSLPGVEAGTESSSSSSEAEKRMTIPGSIRDFRRDHPDFNATPSAGYGHYAGNIELVIGSDSRPRFIGTGFKVVSQWKNKNDQPIPPHLAGGDAKIIRIVTAPTLSNQPVVDTFDSSAGPYNDPNNKGDKPTFVTGSSMPTITAPSNVGPFYNEKVYDGNVTTTMSESFECNKLLVSNHYVLQISGDVTVVCNEEFKIQNHAEIQLMPGSTLTLYCKNIATMQDFAKINVNTANPKLVTIYKLGTTQFIMQNQCELYGTIIAPTATLHIQDGSNFYGNYTGQSVSIQNQGGFHIDSILSFCGEKTDDAMGTPGANSSGGITSANSFAQWYKDILGVNLSRHHPIELVQDSTGIFECLSDAFYPIDGSLLGNEGDPHNYYFTLAFSVDFTHHACEGRFLEFRGTDDAWAFINDDLAIDLGGVIPGTGQVVEVDRLRLVDGQTYKLDFFYAQRNPYVSVFRLRTNLDIHDSDATTTASAGFD